MDSSYNARCPAVKRLLKEAQELHEATEEYYAQPLDDNLFEWHFTVRGPSETDFEGGVYHGRIVLPSEYPMKPPNIIFLTANGRFETNKKICLSISGHHPESWQPSWSIRTALLAIVGFMPTSAQGTLGSLEYTPAERKKLSVKSLDYECHSCGFVRKLLKERTSKNTAFQEEAKEVSAQMVVIGKEKEESEVDEERNSSIEEVPIGASTPKSESLKSEPNTESSPSVVCSSVDNDTHLSFVSHPQTLPVPSERGSTSSPSGTSLANDIILSAAIFLLVALVLRRLFLMEADTLEEMEEAFI